MLYEVEVVADGNSPMDLNRVFDLLTDPMPVARLLAPDPQGADVWCDVVGWDNGQPVLSGDSREGGSIAVGLAAMSLTGRGLLHQ